MSVMHAINVWNEKARAEEQVPVPKVYCLCRDPAVLGQDFYVMQYLEVRHLVSVAKGKNNLLLRGPFTQGRILKDPALPTIPPSERVH